MLRHKSFTSESPTSPRWFRSSSFTLACLCSSLRTHFHRPEYPQQILCVRRTPTRTRDLFCLWQARTCSVTEGTRRSWRTMPTSTTIATPRTTPSAGTLAAVAADGPALGFAALATLNTACDLCALLVVCHTSVLF